MVTLSDLQSRLITRRDAYNRRVGQRDAVLDQHHQAEAEITRLDLDIKTNEQVRYLLQKTSELARETARKILEDTVTNALQYIFGSDYSFIIEIEQKAGRTEASFYVQSPAPKVGPDDPDVMMKLSPEDARGGGVVDIIGLAMRLAVLRIYQDPKVADVLILDEPGKHVSGEGPDGEASFSSLLAEFLKWASSYFSMQVIMVTHASALAAVADKGFLVKQVNGTSQISE